MEDDEEIKKYFAAFHLHDKIPTAVVVDDFGDFFDDRFFLFLFFWGGNHFCELFIQCGSIYNHILLHNPCELTGPAKKDMLILVEETWQWFGR